MPLSAQWVMCSYARLLKAKGGVMGDGGGRVEVGSESYELCPFV